MEPPSPNKRGKAKGDSRSSSNRPYTSIYISLMKIGFQSSDIRVMSFSQALLFIDEWVSMNSTGTSGNVRKATQSDINRMLA